MKDNLTVDDATHRDEYQKLTNENRDERKKCLEQLFAERDEARKNEPVGRLNREEIYEEAIPLPKRNDAD
jgi:hypothetical protein